MSHPQIDQQITFLYTHDLEKSADFYENIFGLKLWIDQGSCRIYSLREGSLIGICQVNKNSKGKVNNADQHENIIFTIVTEQVDKWYAYLKERGIVFEKPPETNTNYNIYHCFLRDPNGYLIEIQRFLKT